MRFGSIAEEKPTEQQITTEGTRPTEEQAELDDLERAKSHDFVFKNRE